MGEPEKEKKSLHRRYVPRTWEVFPPSHTPDNLAVGTGDFVLVERDYTVLETLLNQNFLTSRHFWMFTTKDGSISRKGATKRLQRLTKEGLVARMKIASLYRDSLQGAEYAYSLTAFGLECLALGGHQEAADRISTWKPPYLTNTRRNNIIHELSVADLCTGIMSHFKTADVKAGWRGSRQTFQRVHPMMAGGQRLALAPDAAIVLSTGHTFLVEYEESLRPDTFGSKLAEYRRYFEHEVWQSAYLTPPKILVSASETSDRQRYWGNPFQEVLKMGRKAVFLYQHMFLIKEQNWRRGIWMVQPLAAGEEERPLLDTVIK